MPSNSSRAIATFWIASLLFFLSGGTGLAYQVIWFKRFSHIWGSSTLAMAAVVASFLTGLGLGAHLLGRFADRSHRCLFWYGVAEAAIGLLAVLIPFELRALVAIASWVHPYLAEWPVVHTGVRFVLTFLVMGPACILMGGTLPLLIKRFTPPGSALREATGWLYAINTLGAASGCYLAGFHLLPSYGLFATNLGVAGLNVAIGAVAALVSRLIADEIEPAPAAQVAPSPPPVTAPEKGPRRMPPPQAAPSTGAPTASLWRLHVGVLLTGAASLILEMVWTRQLSVLLGGSTYAFTAMLFLLLVGIGLGSLIFHVWVRHLRSTAWVPAITIVVIAFTAVFGRLLIPHLTLLVGTVKSLRATQGWNALIAVGGSAVLELIPAIGMGILFPACVDLTRRRAEEAGRTIGAVYAWNTAGSLLGSIGTAMFLIPTLGIGGSMALAVSIYATAIILLTIVPLGLRAGAALLVLLLFTGGALAPLASFRIDPLLTDLGMYMYGNISSFWDKYRVVSFEEGSSSNVLVTKQGGDHALRVNGKVDASSGNDMGMQLGLAYFPLFLAPDAKQLCIVGFGSGTTAGAALLFPETHVTCLEIEPAVFRATGAFKDVNHRPQDSPRFKIIFDDGRSHLQGTNAVYDLILSEPSNPWIAGVSNLFTREMYEAARARLSPGGILAQWIQLYSFSAAEYALVARTVLEVFPHCGLIQISGGDTILLASMEPLLSSKERIDRAQAIVDREPRIAADLKKRYETADVRGVLLEHYLMDTKAVRDFIESQGVQAINTDLNMKLEFDAPLRLFNSDDTSKRVLAAILSKVNAEWIRTAATTWGATQAHAGHLRAPLELLDAAAQRGVIKEVTGLALSLDPQNPTLLVDELAMEPPADATAFGAAVDRILALSKKEANRLGVTFFKAKQFDQAVTVFNKVLVQNPQSLTTWNNLAVVHEAQGKFAEARAAFEKALSYDPVNEQTRKSFETFQLKHANDKPAPATSPDAPEQEQGQDPTDPQAGDSAAGSP